MLEFLLVIIWLFWRYCIWRMIWPRLPKMMNLAAGFKMLNYLLVRLRNNMETNIWVYADWIFPNGKGLEKPLLVGKLTSSLVRNKESFRFSYDPSWLNSPYVLPIDPDLQLFSGDQFSDNKNFRIFLDSCPDRWGKLLMKRREAVLAREEQRKKGYCMKLITCSGCMIIIEWEDYVLSVIQLGLFWMTMIGLLHHQ
ncbi:conserved hypothetical protein [Beggiatoa sp. PS]|nr:conserved hypothetical protein [Beggiatoa sp. PS]